MNAKQVWRERVKEEQRVRNERRGMNEPTPERSAAGKPSYPLRVAVEVTLAVAKELQA